MKMVKKWFTIASRDLRAAASIKGIDPVDLVELGNAMKLAEQISKNYLHFFLRTPQRLKATDLKEFYLEFKFTHPLNGHYLKESRFHFKEAYFAKTKGIQ